MPGTEIARYTLVVVVVVVVVVVARGAAGPGAVVRSLSQATIARLSSLISTPRRADGGLAATRCVGSTTPSPPATRT